MLSLQFANGQVVEIKPSLSRFKIIVFLRNKNAKNYLDRENVYN